MLVLLSTHLVAGSCGSSLHALAPADIDRHQSSSESPAASSAHRGILTASLDRGVLAHVRSCFAYRIGLPLHDHIALRLLALSILLVVRGALVSTSSSVGLMVCLLSSVCLLDESFLIMVILRCILLLSLLWSRAL